ncbi:hypothetical protein H632_c977p0, partial [Helicosporidium sp. ATCC 50920]
AQADEPVLLVGETGVGKTALVQRLAAAAGARLAVLNLSQQTDASDLMGGFRPVQPAETVGPLLGRFGDLVTRTWRRGRNAEFVDRVAGYVQSRKHARAVKAFRAAADKALGTGKEGAPSTLSASLAAEWEAFAVDVVAAEAALLASQGGFAFAFVEGVLVSALKQGWWLLLDELNLAPPEALERAAGILEGGQGSLVLAERGDVESVPRHPNFRLFAAMNPSTDAGKRDLPSSMRSRFTELWVAEPDSREDLAALVARYLPGAGAAVVSAAVDFYVEVKREAESSLEDGAGHRPTYSLRTLCRALEYVAVAAPLYGLPRALCDGFDMSFATQLSAEGLGRLRALMERTLLGGSSLQGVQRAAVPAPSPRHVAFEQFWVERGPLPLETERPASDQAASPPKFVHTPSVARHLRNLARAVLLRSYPILLQGPTSSGKTSLIAHLAARTGHGFVRINNHEQTDLQEYVGRYVGDAQGRLVFAEGALVRAMRRGDWVVLDELNLAPTEVLEALNRLLDANRELFVPELQETVRPHPHFMLFATQNPPGIYAGRKTLSRAFRSRFLEILVDDIPDEELATILEQRCVIPPSYAKKMVAVKGELQWQRAASNVFAGRHGFITARDLFRWAGRGADSYDQLAANGFAVLGERLRAREERDLVERVLQQQLRAKLDLQEACLLQDERLDSCARASSSSPTTGAVLERLVRGMVWTKPMRRMHALLTRCLEAVEPALLVGETGTGKTTVCQVAAARRGQRLHILNCNQHTETSDFLGGFRPNRQREAALAQIETLVGELRERPDAPWSEDLRARLAGVSRMPTLQELQALLGLVDELAEQLKQAEGDSEGGEESSRSSLSLSLAAQLDALRAGVAAARIPFVWVDGPLIQAMKAGDIILVDELNLAEDAVLERLNSVLEPERTILLAERGGSDAELVVAHPDFRLVATMNPGGDYGKKELSPALSNRFTSIWVPAIESLEDVRAILLQRLAEEVDKEAVAGALVEFWRFFNAEIASAARQVLSVRDLVSWVEFVNATRPSLGDMGAFAHGAHLVLLDGLGLGLGLADEAVQELQARCHRHLHSLLPEPVGRSLLELHADPVVAVSAAGDRWGAAPFFTPLRAGATGQAQADYDFGASAVRRNVLRVLRALQLSRAVLLEGSPGVGKTS